MNKTDGQMSLCTAGEKNNMATKETRMSFGVCLKTDRRQVRGDSEGPDWALKGPRDLRD